MEKITSKDHHMKQYQSHWKNTASLLIAYIILATSCTDHDLPSQVVGVEEFYQCVATELPPLSSASQYPWNDENSCFAQKWSVPRPAVIYFGDDSNSSFTVSFPYRAKEGSTVPKELSGKMLKIQPTGFLNEAFYTQRMWGPTQLVATSESVNGYPVFKPQNGGRDRFIVGRDFVVIGWLKSDSAFSLSELDGLLYARSKLAGRSEVYYTLPPKELKNIERIDAAIRKTLNSYQIPN